MKKMFALLMTLMIIISAAALPAIAEEGQDQTDTVTSATGWPAATAARQPTGRPAVRNAPRRKKYPESPEWSDAQR